MGARGRQEQLIELPRITRQEFLRTVGLQARKARAAEGLVLLEGSRLLADSLARDAELLWCVVESGKAERFAEIIVECHERGIEVYEAHARDAARLSEVEHAQGIIAVARSREADPCSVFAAVGDAPVSVFWEVADPGNIGTMLRTCDWFGAPGALLSRGSVDPGNPKALRASMGSYFSVTTAMIESPDELVRHARAQHRMLVAADAHGDMALGALQTSAPVCVVFGSEARGLPPAVRAACDAVVSIPPRGTAESLNLAVSHGVVLAYLTRT